jgi:mannose-1-phosphate guanylyltransferase
MEHVYCVIMAGGKGERFWPLSTAHVPKPFVRLIGNRSMIQLTVDRIAGLIGVENVYIVVGVDHLPVARKQLPQLAADQFMAEPVGRDTAPCIGYTATVLRQRDSCAVMVVLPADHYIPDSDAFRTTIFRCIEEARDSDCLITVGISPTRPETGYGYIQAGEGCPDGTGCYEVTRFVEKPDADTASTYLSEGNYYWNAGIFVWRIDVLLHAMEKHMVDLRAKLRILEEAIRNKDAEEVERIFHTFERISIDYGLMEKAGNVKMMKAGFAWDDVGTWSSLKRVMDLDDKGNFVSGQVACLDAHDCVIYGEGIRVGVVGVSNLVVVASKTGVLVCTLDRDQDARQIARFFEEKGTEK